MENTEKQFILTKSQLARLERAYIILDALEWQGVDNWGNYGEALHIYANSDIGGDIIEGSDVSFSDYVDEHISKLDKKYTLCDTEKEITIRGVYGEPRLSYE